MQPNLTPVSRAYQRMVRARTNLVMDEPFFGVLAMRLKLVEDPTCETAWTDSVSLGFNPGYVDSLVDLELRGLVCHEVLHVAAGHPWRQDGRNHERWNEAADYAINPLVDPRKMRLPAGMLMNKAYAGLSAEAIYDLLPPASSESKPQPGKSKASAADEGGNPSVPTGPSSPSPDEEIEGGNGGAEDSADKGANPTPSPRPRPAGEVRPAPAGAPEQAEWKMAVETAARMQGDLPLGLSRFVAEATQASVDWKEVLRHFMQTSSSPSDYAWSRPNTRFLAQGLYMPFLQGQRMGVVVVVRDSSGSIGQQYARMFNGELQDVLESTNPQELYVLDVDAAVHKVQTLMPGEDEEFESKLSGGGGTDFRPAFQWVQEQGIECACLIYLTDLLGRFPDEAPEYPVLWAVPEGSNRGVQPPFGDFVDIALP